MDRLISKTFDVTLIASIHLVCEQFELPDDFGQSRTEILNSVWLWQKSSGNRNFRPTFSKAVGHLSEGSRLPWLGTDEDSLSQEDPGMAALDANSIRVRVGVRRSGDMPLFVPVIDSATRSPADEKESRRYLQNPLRNVSRGHTELFRVHAGFDFSSRALFVKSLASRALIC